MTGKTRCPVMITALALVVFLAFPLAAAALANEGHAHHHAAPEKLGTVRFETSCDPETKRDFDRAVALLHSFWFDGSREAFGKVLETDPSCAMAHWGIAMTWLANPFAWPPPADAVSKGAAAIGAAQAAKPKTERERDWIAALAAFFEKHETVDHRTRAVAYEKKMGDVAAKYSGDGEAAIFHALALEATALPNDKTYANQLRATAILEKIFEKEPDHPGVAHYLIHGYDHPALAPRGLAAAKRYADIAPSAPHALHMPSHIFTRLGLWKESIASNLDSASAAKGDFDRLHAMDYLAYAYLQQAMDEKAKGVLDDIPSRDDLEPHFVVGFALANIPARYAIERGRFEEAAALELRPGFPWERFPQAELPLVFARALGAARTGKLDAAKRDAARLGELEAALASAKQAYWAEQASIGRQAAEAWIAFAAAGKDGTGRDAAIAMLRKAADREDATDKAPVTPGPIAPIRELLGEMLLEAGRPADALKEVEASREREPNRFRGLWLAARAAERAGDAAKARALYADLVKLGADADGKRAELETARKFLEG